MISDRQSTPAASTYPLFTSATTHKKSFWKRHKINSGILFVLPAVIVFLLFVAWPIISTLQASFYDWDGISIHREYIGFENYVNLLTKDRTFRMSIQNNIIWAVVSISALTVLSFLIAYMLNQRLRFRNLYRVLLFLPTTASLAPTPSLKRTTPPPGSSSA